MSQTASASQKSHFVEALQAENLALKAQLQSLQSQLDWFKRQLFGEKSEKRDRVDPAIQADLLAGLSESLPHFSPATEKITYERRKKSRDNAVTDKGLRFDDSVPVETIVLPLSADGEKIPEDKRIPVSEKISYRLAQRPGSYVILKYVRPVVKHADSDQFIATPAPLHVLDKSIADVSFLAGMLVDKFVYHLPLYRQHQRLAQSGITLARMTLTTLVGRAIDLLVPIHDAQFQQVLQNRVLAMDETPIKAGRKSKGKMNQGRFWPLYGENDEVVFHYTKSRAASHVKAILGKHFQGVLVSDGYAAYAQYTKRRESVIHGECWAHTRRMFERAEKAEPEAVDQALTIIGSLYHQEKCIREKGLSGQSKLNYRSKHSTPLVKSFWQWCESQCRRHDLLPKNPLTRALKYAMARTEALQVFLTDPDVPIDTNHLERALRSIPMGRKNWMFCWTEIGAQRVAVIQTLLITCKLQGINPYTYLVDVLQRISQHPAKDVLELTPRLWKGKFADKLFTSDLDRVNNGAE